MGYLPALISDQLAPGHPEELDGKEDAADGDDDENSRFGNGNRPDVRYPVCDTVTDVENSEKEHGRAGKPADDGHDEIEIALRFFIEMNVDDIGGDMPSLPQKPGCSKEDDPQQGIFGYRHDPDRRLGK